ncbi:hypothetical protein QAD02_022193 [Eretmocerus hayati]|uniref:Uncharacterized protein n=1 Tax=Eretmocerus hayati TaxID=131215 RepID=A0ACC2PSW8_9HYME|nr:hypothetical protein QAD02_022193 [Eretmocerus hayati]
MIFSVSTDILLEFLDVALHSILYYRKLYPEEIFTVKKVYGIPVHVSVHPEVNSYIENILGCTKKLVQENKSNLEAVSIVCIDKNKVPVEKYTFGLEHLRDNILDKDPYFIKTEDALRTLCLKLSLIESYLEPLPPESTFTINITTNRAAFLSLSEQIASLDFPLIIENHPAEVKNGFLLPIKDLCTDFLALKCYAVKSKAGPSGS